MASEIKPGPQPGNPPPRKPYKQPITGNGRPPETAAVRSPGEVQPAPPVPQVGFKLPWPGMHDQASPQPVAEIGKPAYNPLTGEWFLG